MVAWVANPNPDTQQKVLLEVVQEKTVKNLIYWLNNFALRSAVTDIPSDFINSNGRLIVELTEILSGKKFPNLSTVGK